MRVHNAGHTPVSRGLMAPLEARDRGIATLSVIFYQTSADLIRARFLLGPETVPQEQTPVLPGLLVRFWQRTLP